MTLRSLVAFLLGLGVTALVNHIRPKPHPEFDIIPPAGIKLKCVDAQWAPNGRYQITLAEDKTISFVLR